MASCKICSQPVIAGSVMHEECLKEEAEKLAEIICDEYCHWPFVCQDEEELNEKHCASCEVLKMLGLEA